MLLLYERGRGGGFLLGFGGFHGVVDFGGIFGREDGENVRYFPSGDCVWL